MVKYIHKAGDVKWYKKDPVTGADILVENVTDEYAAAKTDLYMLQKPTEYVDKGLRYPTQLWKFKRDILTSNLHPTQKPLVLIMELIKIVVMKK